MYIGEWIKKYRTEHSLSMQDFADRCGFSKAYIGLLEKGVNPKTNRPIDMTEIIPENFITLSVRLKALNETEIRAKYSKQVAEKILSTQYIIESMVDKENSSFAIRIEHYHYATKNRTESTEQYHIEKEAKEGVRIIKELKDPNETHKYSMKSLNKEINKRLLKAGITLLDANKKPSEFNQYHFGLFNSYFKIKENEKFCYTYHISSQPQYSYSQQALDFIYEQIKKAPDSIIKGLKEKTKKSTPGAKDSKH